MEKIEMADGTVVETGCWIAGHHGWRANLEVVAIAEAFGFVVEGADQTMLAHYANDTYEADLPDGTTVDVADWIIGIGGLVDQATDYLNTLVPDGYRFGWYDGEFFLWPLTEWEEA